MGTPKSCLLALNPGSLTLTRAFFSCGCLFEQVQRGNINYFITAKQLPPLQFSVTFNQHSFCHHLCSPCSFDQCTALHGTEKKIEVLLEHDRETAIISRGKQWTRVSHKSSNCCPEFFLILPKICGRAHCRVSHFGCLLNWREALSITAHNKTSSRQALLGEKRDPCSIFFLRQCSGTPGPGNWTWIGLCQIWESIYLKCLCGLPKCYPDYSNGRCYPCHMKYYH